MKRFYEARGVRHVGLARVSDFRDFTALSILNTIHIPRTVNTTFKKNNSGCKKKKLKI
jgi:hypothetical protein